MIKSEVVKGLEQARKNFGTENEDYKYISQAIQYLQQEPIGRGKDLTLDDIVRSIFNTAQLWTTSAMRGNCDENKLYEIEEATVIQAVKEIKALLPQQEMMGEVEIENLIYAKTGVGKIQSKEIAHLLSPHIPAGKENHIVDANEKVKPLPEKTKERSVEVNKTIPEKTCLNCGYVNKCLYPMEDNNEPCKQWQPQEVKVIEPLIIFKPELDKPFENQIQEKLNETIEQVNHLTQDKK